MRYKTDKRPVVKLESVSLSNLKTQGGWLEDLKSGVTTGRFDFDKTTYSLPRTPGFYNGDDGHFAQMSTLIQMEEEELSL